MTSKRKKPLSPEVRLELTARLDATVRAAPRPTPPAGMTQAQWDARCGLAPDPDWEAFKKQLEAEARKRHGIPEEAAAVGARVFPRGSPGPAGEKADANPHAHIARAGACLERVTPDDWRPWVRLACLELRAALRSVKAAKTAKLAAPARVLELEPAKVHLPDAARED